MKITMESEITYAHDQNENIKVAVKTTDEKKKYVHVQYMDGMKQWHIITLSVEEVKQLNELLPAVVEQL